MLIYSSLTCFRFDRNIFSCYLAADNPPLEPQFSTSLDVPDFEVSSSFHSTRLYVCFHFVEVSQQLKAIGTLDTSHVTLALFVSPGAVFGVELDVPVGRVVTWKSAVLSFCG